MEDLVASIPVLAGTAVIVALIFFFTSRSKKRRLKLIQNLATAQGWEYQTVEGRLESGFRLSANGWTFESIARSTDRPSESGAPTVSHSALWQYPSAAANDLLVYIGEKPPGADSEFGAGLIRQALHLFLGSEADGMEEVQAGISAFRRRYLLLAQRPADAENLLTPNLEHLLVNYPGRAPVIRVDKTGIRMNADGVKLDKPEEITSFIRLGEAVIDALR